MGPTQPPMKWVLSSSVKGQERELDLSPPSSTEVQNKWNCNLPLSPCLTSCRGHEHLYFWRTESVKPTPRRRRACTFNALDSMNFVFCENTAAQNEYTLRGSDNLVRKPPNTAYQHGPVTASFRSAQTDDVIPVPKTSTVFREGVHVPQWIASVKVKVCVLL
jgi:hypothetical protein